MPDGNLDNAIISAKISNWNGILDLFSERPSLRNQIDLAAFDFLPDTFYFLSIAVRGNQQHVQIFDK